MDAGETYVGAQADHALEYLQLHATCHAHPPRLECPTMLESCHVDAKRFVLHACDGQGPSRHYGNSTPAHRFEELLKQADLSQGVPLRWAGLDARAHSVLLFQLPSPRLQKGVIHDGDLTLRLFDDPESRKTADFEDSWRAFLHAWNLLQFHPRGVEVVSTEYLERRGDDLSAPVSAATLPSTALPAEPPSEAPPPSVRGRRTTKPPAPSDVYGAFAEAFKDGKHLPELADLLRAEGLPVPVDAGECELPIDLEALLYWPDCKLVLVPEPTDADLDAWQRRGFTALDYDAPAAEILTALRRHASPPR